MKKRNRIVYLVISIIVILLGLIYKKYSSNLPEFLNGNLGDVLYAILIFFGFGFIFTKLKTYNVAMIALIFCFCVEFSQMYHAQWINNIRANKFGGLILGYGFSAGDLVCYVIGVFAGAAIEKAIHKAGNVE